MFSGLPVDGHRNHEYTGNPTDCRKGHIPVFEHQSYDRSLCPRVLVNLVRLSPCSRSIRRNSSMFSSNWINGGIYHSTEFENRGYVAVKFIVKSYLNYTR
ncbi:hypothetical protein NPIL_423581 [Nephila pilipes]|uniref:Uncharacterized protein n=1 Tax=Nephila pilipes TaxID=299642 RepID=A0A8X6IRU7_NEPPI|nr:hypothetical protein NPIL_423581 [Nephila pilipes]